MLKRYSLSHSYFSRVSDDRKANLCLQYDMGWQKRGSGRKYDSMSGVGTMIRHYTGKIINHGVRSKTCRTCTSWSNKNVGPPEHDCSKNFLGTSKAMKADVGATL